MKKKVKMWKCETMWKCKRAEENWKLNPTSS